MDRARERLTQPQLQSQNMSNEFADVEARLLTEIRLHRSFDDIENRLRRRPR
jgi:hypothetical protein